MNMPSLRRRPVQHLVTLNGDGLHQRILFPSSLKLDVAHTITENPPPKPHALSVVINVPNGNRWVGTPDYITGHEHVLHLSLPGNFVYLRDWEHGTYIPISVLDCEVWWNH